jgi:hypothetical protein
MYLEIDRSNIRNYRITADQVLTTEQRVAALGDGEVLMRIEKFALTSNNISYALAGDFLDYWGFFPTEAGWGRLPAMGFGVIEASKNNDIAAGGRYFGFYPVASHHIVQAELTSTGFSDIGLHREKHAMAYRNFEKVPAKTADETTASENVLNENASLIFRGLFMTSFLAEDFLRESEFFGATQVIITSASSKTSIALAQCLRTNAKIRIVGLTASANVDFVKLVDLYDDVVSYDQIESLDKELRSVIVDMSGNRSIVARVHQHFARSLMYSCAIGATHWESTQSTTNIVGVQPQFFFAPSQLSKRGKQWGRDELNSRISKGLENFIGDAHAWLHIDYSHGEDAVSKVYEQLVGGLVRPEVGHVLAF